MRTFSRVHVSRARLIQILSQHRGEAAAITADDLAVVLGCRERSNRALREAILELIADGWCIGSTSREDRPGYFLIQTRAELETVKASLRRRARELDLRAECLDRAFATGGPRQPALFGDRGARS